MVVGVKRSRAFLWGGAGRHPLDQGGYGNAHPRQGRFRSRSRRYGTYMLRCACGSVTFRARRVVQWVHRTPCTPPPHLPITARRDNRVAGIARRRRYVAEQQSYRRIARGQSPAFIAAEACGSCGGTRGSRACDIRACKMMIDGGRGAAL